MESHVGRALEEFREYAEELKYRTAGGKTRICLSPTKRSLAYLRGNCQTPTVRGRAI